MSIATDDTNTRRQALNAKRVRRHYRRRTSGLAVMQVEVAYVALTEMLIREHFLQAWDAGDRAAVQRALEEFIAAELSYK